MAFRHTPFAVSEVRVQGFSSRLDGPYNGVIKIWSTGFSESGLRSAGPRTDLGSGIGTTVKHFLHFFKGAGMREDLEQRLRRLEKQYEDASARLMVSEGLLSAVVRHLPHAAAVIEDFKVHQDYLEIASLNSTGATDEWIAKLKAAREVMLFRLSVSADRAQPGPGSTR